VLGLIQVLAGLFFLGAGIYGLGQSILLFRYHNDIVGAIRWWQLHPESADEPLRHPKTDLPVPDQVDRFVRGGVMNARRVKRRMTLVAHGGPWRIFTWAVVSLLLSLLFVIGGIGGLITGVKSWPS
jgi:hypothetical protein